MAIAWLTHLRISIPASGAPPGHGPADCYPGGAPRKNRLGSLRVSFADDVTMLGEVSPSMCSPVLEKPTPIVSAVVVDDVVILEGETNGSSDVVPDVIPPPPGFPPFSWPIIIGHVAIKQSGSPFGDGGSPDVLASQPDVEPPFSPITQAQDSESVGSPDVELLVSPLVDVGTDTVTDVNRPVSPLPTVENLFVQDRLWAPVALPDVDDRRETPVPRWRLAREGPFQAERSPESIRSLGLDVLSGICHTAVWRLQGSSDFLCIIRGSSSGSGFHSRPAFWRWAPVGGWTICRVIRRLLPPCNYNGMWV